MATAGDIESNANSNGSEDTPSPGVVSESATERVGTEQAINETNVGIKRLVQRELHLMAETNPST